MDKKYAVFVSSPYKFLEEERQAVMEQLLELGCIPVGMEFFPGSSDDQMTYIKRLIDQSDYYIVILAGRYGTIEEKTGRGFTELEFDYAEEKGIPIIPFLYKDIDKLAVDMVDTGKNRKKLLMFRSRLERNHIVKYFTDKNELKAAVSAAIHNVIIDHPRPGWIRGDKIEIALEKDFAINADDEDIDYSDFENDDFYEYRKNRYEGEISNGRRNGEGKEYESIAGALHRRDHIRCEGKWKDDWLIDGRFYNCIFIPNEESGELEYVPARDAYLEEMKLNLKYPDSDEIPPDEKVEEIKAYETKIEAQMKELEQRNPEPMTAGCMEARHFLESLEPRVVKKIVIADMTVKDGQEYDIIEETKKSFIRFPQSRNYINDWRTDNDDTLDYPDPQW